jgi:hypothetical protein
MLRRLLRPVFPLLLALMSLPARGTDYSDIWWNPNEPGWGVNIAQSDAFIFATFFVYDAGNLPTWYAGNLTSDGHGNYSGGLFAATGSYYGTVPYNSAQFSVNQVGTATFTPSAADTAVLTYNVGSTNVTKNIQRQTLTTIALGGNYTGGQAGAYSGSSCPFGAYKDNFDLALTQNTDGTVSLQFAFTSGISCTFSGTLQQKGQLYSIPNANYSCSTGLNTSANVFELKATSLGVEGQFGAANVGSGCREDAQFSGVLL